MSKSTQLDIRLLADIREFREYDIMDISVDRPVILFHVGLLDGTTGLVHCGPWIHGRPKSFTDLFLLKMKVCRAKELVNWEYLGEKFGIKKDEMLRIAWADNFTQTESV